MVSEENEQQSDVNITKEGKNDRISILQAKYDKERNRHSCWTIIKVEHKSPRRIPLTQNIFRLQMKEDGNYLTFPEYQL